MDRNVARWLDSFGDITLNLILDWEQVTLHLHWPGHKFNKRGNPCWRPTRFQSKTFGYSWKNRFVPFKKKVDCCRDPTVWNVWDSNAHLNALVYLDTLHDTYWPFYPTLFMRHDVCHPSKKTEREEETHHNSSRGHPLCVCVCVLICAGLRVCVCVAWE